MRAVRAAVRGGLTGWRVQAWAIGLVLLATATSATLGAGLLADSDAPFDHAFAGQHGADVAVTVAARTADGRKELAATARLAGVTAAAGPFAEAAVTAVTVTSGASGATQLPSLTLVGRASPGGPVDDIVLSSGHWPTAAGQIVVARGRSALSTGQVITLTGVPGDPKLTVVGVGISATGTAGGWVLPAEMTALGVRLTEQMLYRFTGARSATAVNADIAAVRRALPAGTVLGAESWLTVKAQETQDTGPWVPFLVAFGLLGLVMSVLIVVSVVSGAVIAGTRRIGVLKSVGFTPAQVVSVYVLQVAMPAAAGVAAGAVLANLLAEPVLSRASQVLAVAPQFIPLWTDLAVPLAMLALAAIAALVPASRAGRLSAVQAIATGRAPQPSRGHVALRLLGRVRVLPRPVLIGLAEPFSRPGRTLVTLSAITFGAVTVTFGVGLGSSIYRVGADASQPDEQVVVAIPGLPAQGAPAGAGSVAAQERAATAAIRSQPGTVHYVTESDDQLAVAGMAGTATVTAFGGNASWTGYTMISGHWYGADGRQAVVNTEFLEATGKQVGDTFTLTGNGRSVTLAITGEAFDADSSATALTSLSSVAALDPPGLSPVQYDVGLRPGVNAQGYANAVYAKLGQNYGTIVSSNPLLNPLNGLIGFLTLLLAAVAGLGVLNTVLLTTRERTHDIGVFKAVGMTPRQVIAMVVTTVAATGLIAGVIAVPAGIALHHAILPLMADGAQTALPPAIYNAYNPVELALLALAGLVIAVAGALAPAGWAARTPTALALRAE
jgi:putative ABC transport system permease protein